MKVKTSPLIKKAKQRGDVLLQALVGMLLLTTLGLSIVYTISRVSVSQRDMNIHNLVVSQLRTELRAGNVKHDDLVIGRESFTIKNHNKNIEVTINGKKVDVAMHALSVDHPSLGGQICVGPIQCDL